MTEVVVAAIVLVVVISVLTQLVVRGGRLQIENRLHQVALEELSNQLDRLINLDEGARTDAFERLTPSPEAQTMLPSAELQAEVFDDANGRRLVLSLAWDRYGQRRPITLVGWLPPADAPAPERTEARLP